MEGTCYVRVAYILSSCSLGKGVRTWEALVRSLPVWPTRSCALVGVFALSRLAELFMRAQYPVSPVEPTLLLLCNLVLYDEQWRNPGFMFAWQKEVCLLCGGWQNFVLKHDSDLLKRIQCLYQRSRPQVCVVGAEGVLLRGQWDNMGSNRKHISHGWSHYRVVRYSFLIVIVIYFQVFCFSNLILSPYCLTVNC